MARNLCPFCELNGHKSMMYSNRIRLNGRDTRIGYVCTECSNFFPDGRFRFKSPDLTEKMKEVFQQVLTFEKYRKTLIEGERAKVELSKTGIDVSKLPA